MVLGIESLTQARGVFKVNFQIVHPGQLSQLLAESKGSNNSKWMGLQCPERIVFTERELILKLLHSKLWYNQH